MVAFRLRGRRTLSLAPGWDRKELKFKMQIDIDLRGRKFIISNLPDDGWVDITQRQDIAQRFLGVNTGQVLEIRLINDKPSAFRYVGSQSEIRWFTKRVNTLNKTEEAPLIKSTEIIEAKSTPVVVSVDGTQITNSNETDTTIVVNELGRRALISCLGRLTPDELLAKQLTHSDISFLSFLWASLGGGA